MIGWLNVKPNTHFVIDRAMLQKLTNWCNIGRCKNSFGDVKGFGEMIHITLGLRLGSVQVDLLDVNIIGRLWILLFHQTCIKKVNYLQYTFENPNCQMLILNVLFSTCWPWTFSKLLVSESAVGGIARLAYYSFLVWMEGSYAIVV